jgi:hypothetical protein
MNGGSCGNRDNLFIGIWDKPDFLILRYWLIISYYVCDNHASWTLLNKTYSKQRTASPFILHQNQYSVPPNFWGGLRCGGRLPYLCAYYWTQPLIFVIHSLVFLAILTFGLFISPDLYIFKLRLLFLKASLDDDPCIKIYILLIKAEMRCRTKK